MLKTLETQEVFIDIDSLKIAGLLTVPYQPHGLVLFVHGSGSSRFSSRNNFVAKILNDNNIATLLLDLLTLDEENDQDYIFDIKLLANRLKSVTKWVQKQSNLKYLPIGYFGASTGAGAALQAAASNQIVKAVVSRGGRPDLAMSYLSRVLAPTLLIIGGCDEEVLKLNKIAFSKLNSIKKIEVVSGATHLFEEPGALQEMATLACSWFTKYLGE